MIIQSDFFIGIDVQLLDTGSVARSGVKLDDVKDIVIHYVGKLGSTAQQNRDYFNNPESKVSSHGEMGKSFRPSRLMKGHLPLIGGITIRFRLSYATRVKRGNSHKRLTILWCC